MHEKEIDSVRAQLLKLSTSFTKDADRARTRTRMGAHGLWKGQGWMSAREVKGNVAMETDARPPARVHGYAYECARALTQMRRRCGYGGE